MVIASLSVQSDYPIHRDQFESNQGQMDRVPSSNNTEKAVQDAVSSLNVDHHQRQAFSCNSVSPFKFLIDKYSQIKFQNV